MSFFVRGHFKYSKNSNSKFIRDALPSVYLWHSAKPLFAECQIKYTRQKNLAKKNLKIPNGPKKLPKFHVKQSMLSIAYTKSFELKQHFKKFWTQTTIRPSIWLQILSDPSQLFDFSSEMYRFVSTYVTKCAKPPQFFFTTYTYDIMTSCQIS